MNFAPLFIAGGIVVAVWLLGLIISHWRQSHAFRDYEEYATDAQAVASNLNAEIFRDGIDLVVSGNYGRLPTVVRFSHADNTPGLNMKMRAPATFTMSVLPKGAKGTEGRVLLRTPDDNFDARFVTRTDHPTQARIFVTSKGAFAQVQKLCCSSQTFLTLTAEGVELSELTIPTPYTGRHIRNHLDSMAVLANALQQMPGADAIKITPFKKEHSKVIRVALAIGALTAIVAVAGAMFTGGGNTAAGGAPVPQDLAPDGLTAAEARRIAGAVGFRLARASDFDPDGQAWVRAQTGHDITPRVDAEFSADGLREAAYVLLAEAGGDAGVKRVVVVTRDQVSFDAAYPQLALVAKVPRSNLASIQWVGRPAPADGDGLLLVRNVNDPRSGAVIYLSRGRIETAVPVTYQSVAIQ